MGLLQFHSNVQEELIVRIFMLNTIGSPSPGSKTRSGDKSSQHRFKCKSKCISLSFSFFVIEQNRNLNGRYSAKLEKEYRNRNNYK